MRRLRIQQWSLGRVVRAMEGRLLSPTVESGMPRGVSTDTRKLGEGDLFFALRGENFDGHEFVDAAVERGACAVVVEDRSALGSSKATAIVVDDCYRALSRLGHAVYRAARQDGTEAIALTGSNGKTTTKEILSALWSGRGTVWATQGNLNNHIGVPLTLCAIPAECDRLIVELGANHRGEIENLIGLVPAEQRIVTSIGRAHLEGFGSMAGVRKAKGEIFTGSSRATTAIVPLDEVDALIPRDFPGNVITFGGDNEADIQILSTFPADGDEWSVGMGVRLDVAGQRVVLALPLVGAHNATNLAAAVATFVGGSKPVDADGFNDLLATLDLPGGRFRVLQIGGLRVMDDAYNANPSSMRASFRAFEQWADGDDGKSLAIIGDMHELGEVADREHRELASWLAQQTGLSALAFVGEYASLMSRAAEGGGVSEVVAFEDHDSVAQWLREHERAQVFLKGSRANRLEKIIEKLKS